jgi:S1-C subfamily serine protease/antitoxin component YwqK of YwqJK toxin-antitoxin module
MKEIVTKICIIILFFGLYVPLKSQTLKDEWVVCNNQGCKLLDPYYSEEVTMKWEGSCVNGKANGYGKLIKYKNGEYESTYEGEFQNGIREGKGKFSHVSGTILVCNFTNGQAMGYGKYDLGDDNYYEGDIVNYRQHGNGVKTFANGSKFEGFFVSDKMYTGKFTNYDGKITYLQKYYTVDKINEKSSGYKPVIGKRVTEYFDAKWNRCKQKDASYYRLVTYELDNKPIGVVKDYYINGELQSEFTAVYLDYDDEGKNFHEGEATWYQKSGRIEQKRYYYNNKINGKNTFYYDNGEVAREYNYNYGVKDGFYQEWYKTGKPKLTAVYEQGNLVENKYIEYDENGLGALVYNENFYANKEQWEGKSDGSYSQLTNEGNISLVLTNDDISSRYNYITLEQNSSYSIESIIQKKSGKGNEGYGIIFGFKDWNNYYKFLISEYGSYIIFSQFEGVNIRLCEWTKSKTIFTGNQRNLLKIIKIGDEFIFSINGEVVERLKSKDLRGNNIGITAGGKGEYILENIIVKEFLSAEKTAQWTPKESNNDEWKGNGSGFFIHEDGYVVTNYHVIEKAKKIEVVYNQNGKKFEMNAKIESVDKENDLAILRINDPGFVKLSTIPYVFTVSPKDVGTEVFAMGYPISNYMGDEVKFTDGKISAQSGFKGDSRFYQISVPIQPGNSGGPLFDNKGNLIGITSSGLNKEMFGSENVNYAIKTYLLKKLISQINPSFEYPENISIYSQTLTEKIKTFTDFVPLILVK